MSNARLLGSLLAVALFAPAGQIHAQRSHADVVFEWNQVLQEQIATAPALLTPALLLDDAHRDVRRDQRDRARLQPVSGAPADVGRRLTRGGRGAGGS